MDLNPTAPAVVAVIITCEPGEWFEEVLSAFGAQDYPNLSVLVLDAASSQNVASRVAAVLPDAYVRRLGERAGFGKCANEAISMVEGASHLFLCHDDVAPDPDAVRLIVEEAFRSNAGITSPKIVDWHEPSRIISVGQASDRLGVVHPCVDPGDLDQGQHDAVRDVFVAPSGAMLIRSDLFTALGGFDPKVDAPGEDLDLCWRAQVAGARVVVAPQSRVRHLEGTLIGQRSELAGATLSEQVLVRDVHRLRTLWKCSGRLSMVHDLPAALVHAIAETCWLLLRGRGSRSLVPLDAFFRSFSEPKALAESRKTVQDQRRAHDREIRRTQSRGSARLKVILRALVEGAVDHALSPSAQLEARRGETSPATVAEQKPNKRLKTITWVALLAVLFVGSRDLLSHALPQVGSLPSTRGGLGQWWHVWNWWAPGGMGSAQPAPPALGVLALLGTIFFGAISVVQHLVVLGPLVLGPVGVYRTSRVLGSVKAQLAATAAYVIVPLPYDALSHGRWGGIVVYGAAPWVLGIMLKAWGEEPWKPQTHRAVAVIALRLALLLAIVGSVVPLAFVAVPLVGIGMALGGLLVGKWRRAPVLLIVSVASSVVAFVVTLPWSAGALCSSHAIVGASGVATSAFGLGQLLRLDTGPIGSSVFSWGMIAAAAFALVATRSSRLQWVARFLGIVVLCTLVGWLEVRGWLPFGEASPDVFLAFSAAGLSAMVGIGVVTFEAEVAGSLPGWRHIAAIVATFGIVAAALPVLAGAGNGMWKMPSTGAESAFVFPSPHESGDYRVLWIGDQSNLALGSDQVDGIGYGVSYDGPPDVGASWPSFQSTTNAALAQFVGWAIQSRTTKFGHLLGSLGIRYVVVVSPAARSPHSGSAEFLNDVLGTQTDLEPMLESGPGTQVYSDTSWIPVRSVVASDLAQDLISADPHLIQFAKDLLADPALSGQSLERAKGVIHVKDQGESLYSAVGGGSSQVLHVNGVLMEESKTVGGFNAWPLPAGSVTVDLKSQSSLSQRVAASLSAFMIILLAVLLLAEAVLRDRTQERRSEGA